MRIGYACTPITIDAKNSRSFMLKNLMKNFMKSAN